MATLTSFMGPFMISSVNVALPAIQKDLKMTAVQLGWVATAYLPAMAVGLIPAGKLADIHGRKKVFSIGLIVYTTGAAATALVHTTAWFLFLRVIQGLGAALFVTTGMAILTSIFPPRKRGRAIGVYVSAVYAFGQAVYRRFSDPAVQLAQHLCGHVSVGGRFHRRHP